jgi:hypothetical protein
MTFQRSTGPTGKSVWWPSTDPTFQFHATCPTCGKSWNIFQHRVPVMGVVPGRIGCKCGAQWDDIRLEGWNDSDAVPPGPLKYPVRREILHHECEQVRVLPEDVATAMARDPRSFGGHYCDVCGRYAHNHEWVFAGDGHEVGDGWFGERRYSDLPAETLAAFYVQHYPVRRK